MRTVSAKYSLGEKEKEMERERGSEGISKRETEKEVREERSRALSEGWMNWSMSGGACSRTRGQKLGIWETVDWRLV